jgi:small subunit ribosomal protein S15
MVLSTDKKKDIIKEFGRDKNDSGSPEVQVALLTARIKELTEHLKTHKKDFDTRRSLLVLVNRRSKLLSFLKDKSEETYQEILGKLDIRK